MDTDVCSFTLSQVWNTLQSPAILPNSANAADASNCAFSGCLGQAPQPREMANLPVLCVPYGDQLWVCLRIASYKRRRSCLIPFNHLPLLRGDNMRIACMKRIMCLLLVVTTTTKKGILLAPSNQPG